MHKFLLMFLLAGWISPSFAQYDLKPLTVEKIMRDPKWMGTSPSQLQWNRAGDTLFFLWNPDQLPADSLYFITLKNTTPQKATVAQRQFLSPPGAYVYNERRSQYVFEKNGDIFFADLKSGQTKRITQTIESENDPQFSFNEDKIVYKSGSNLYAWDIHSGETQQLTNIGFTRKNPEPAKNTGAAEKWLNKDQLQHFEVLRERKIKNDTSEAYRNALPKEKPLRYLFVPEGAVRGLSISPDGRFVSYRVFKSAQTRNTIIPNYITESGYTTDIFGRTKVGAEQGVSRFFIFDRKKDTVLSLPVAAIPGIPDLPSYLTDYPPSLAKRKKDSSLRNVTVGGISWSRKGRHAVVDIYADDNKDRWLMLWNMDTNELTLLDRQHDDAWIGGPGIHSGNVGWISEEDCWFQSEATGYAHLYTVNVQTLKKRPLTSGSYEVQQAILSKDKKSFFITTNEVHPGEKHFYRLLIASGKQERITQMTGANEVELSPNEQYIALLHSYSNKPWELYLQPNKPGAAAQQITFKAQSDAFKSYAWRDPEVITFTAADGAKVHARVYKPAHPHPERPAVLFVHGAGYLQNAHKWWSSYFREYMFNNLLADNGYYVMDIDYRASAGYGRDWRTGIYRHMGGKDLSDHVDAVKYLVENFNVNPRRVGLYGGSYGGFISLMAMFTKPDVFAAGAALRPVTDWANYNHGYTSNILNEPYADSLAYYRSSPIYFANGLKGHLLICHGMVDVNVHFQDAVKLSQRLIELGKDNWELASYPMEGHGFIEPSSWTDEYKRIFKLFETVLKK
ncbi:prolyl oligopeptidase family serine peptidase [Niabella insulamsoli]|uniref:S9 family peptidase n=1 Tax=Niabella insulamsoli TaxID=3144874 RepID=UPI0031FE3378